MAQKNRVEGIVLADGLRACRLQVQPSELERRKVRWLLVEAGIVLRCDDAAQGYMQDFLHTVQEQSFATLPGLSVLG